MAISDMIADCLTRVRNAKEARHKYVDVGYSKLNRSILGVLERLGYVRHCLVDEQGCRIRVFLKYRRQTQESVIHGLKRMSKPGKRCYVGYREVPRVLSGLGTAILSTSSGVIDGEEARSLKVGGELLCIVW